MNFQTYRPTVRLRATSGGPLRSNNDYQFGFYDIGVFRHALEHTGSSEYRVATLPIPANAFDLADLEKILNHPSIQYAIVDKNKIVLTIVEGQTGWMSVFNDMGFTVKGGNKTAKRMKSFHRATLLNAHYDHLNVHWVDSNAYCRYDLNYTGDGEMWYNDPKVINRLLDGGFVVSSRIVQKAVQNLPTNGVSEDFDASEYYYDPTIRQHLTQFLLSSKVYNGRILMSEGMIKGNFIVSDNLPEHVDVISSRENLKTEICYHSGFRLLAEPQGPKSRVITDDQTVINLPKLFTKEDTQFWLEEEYEKMFQKAVKGELLTNWKSVFVRNFNRENQDVEDVEAQSRIGYVGYRWVSMGLSITNSPWLFETLAISHAKPLQKRIPIPCAVYEQIIPESLAKMAGFNIEVEPGTIRRINSVGVHIVNDMDWLEMYESHGGHDQDDFFKLFYRTMKAGPYDGQRVVIAVRSPNGYGEYSIFRYVEDEWFPTWEKSDGEEISFPEVNGRNWPQRLSEAIYEGKVKYSGLPSSHKKNDKRSEDETYTVKDVLRDVKVAMNGGNIGRYVNAAMLYSMVISEHRPAQVCSMESAIDGCINAADSADREAIDLDAENMIAQVLSTGKPIDRDFWQGRFRSLAKKHPEIETYEGRITQLNTLCNESYKAYTKRVVEYSQEHIRPLEIIHQLGQRMYYHSLPLLRHFRMSIFNANAMDAVYMSSGITREEWNSLYNMIVNAIISHERVQDQHDFILALYSASIKNPTSNGKVTDQIVMNPLVYPYLEAALIHYGIGNKVVMSHKNGETTLTEIKTDTWIYPNENGENIEFKDPFEYQKFHSQHSPIVHTTTTPQVGRRMTAEF